MSKSLFNASKDDLGENWFICWTGQDNIGNHWNVVTNHIHGSDLHSVSKGAQGDAELIANLLNWYYTDIEKADSIMLVDALESLRD